MKKLFQPTFILSLVAIITTQAMGQTTIGVGDVFPGKVEYAAFSVNTTTKVSIHVTGGAFHHEDWRKLVHYGWIIETETRKPVWHAADKLEDGFEYGEFEVKDEISLKPGNYEVYFASSYHQQDNYWSFDGIGGFVNEIFSDRKRSNYNSEMREGMGITVSGNVIRQTTSALIESKVKDALVSITKPDHNANEKKGFSLSAETTIRIYAIGELEREETFDYAWIYDVDKRKRVWVMDYSNSDYAGGARKNRVSDEELKLPAGNYLVSYVTDDSHAYNDWNSLPPDDPQFSGVTIWANNKANIVPFKMPEEVTPVLQITQVRDDAHVTKGLTIKSAVDLRVLSIGEQSDDEMVDNGYIMNAATRQVVWDMADRRKEHAGGAEKNKMVDETIRLEKGDYIVAFTTDDSHAFGDWNSGPPHEQDHYGITLWVTKKEDLPKISLFDPTSFKNKDVVVEILRVRDDEQFSETFTLDRDTNLRIFAIGEGDDDELVDYGWIRNTDTGKVVWEMTYRNTEPAGGAAKNRLFNGTIILPKGTYKVYYETDGSHSYRDWNASPPRDPERYGITITKE
ncbi:MAG TPA: hypothetical protein VGD65_01875 [Chryseosolibacter sp.]